MVILLLRLLIFQLQRQRCSKLERFYIGEKKLFYFKNVVKFYNAGVVNFYNAGVVNRSRGIGSSIQVLSHNLEIVHKKSSICLFRKYLQLMSLNRMARRLFSKLWSDLSGRKFCSFVSTFLSCVVNRNLPKTVNIKNENISN
jgi:hypothetical protein